MYTLNAKLRPAADAFAITAKNSEPAKDTIKIVAKELEESGVFQELISDNGSKAVGAAFVFSFLEPV